MDKLNRPVSSFFAKVPARFILYFLGLTCMIVSYIMRTVINLTILAMVKESNDSNYVYENNTGTSCLVKKNSATVNKGYGGTLEWSIDVQYYVLTSFYWTYIISQVLGGIAAHKYGAKVVIGVGLLTSAVCNLCIPFGSEWSYAVIIILQLLNGCGQGLVWPAFYSLISWWTPTHERSRFLTCLQGLSIGITVSQLMSGFVIASVGWKYVFYISGILGLVWCVVWYLLAFNKPELHPRIFLKELNYIKKHRGNILPINKKEIPWKSILLSLPVWAIGISMGGRMWFFSIVQVYGPVYLKSIIGLSVAMNGFWGGVISFSTFLSSVMFSYVADMLVAYNIIPTQMNRKIFTGIGMIVPGLCCISMSYLGCNPILNLAVWGLSQMLQSSCYSGAMVNIVDIAPNLTGSVTSLIQILIMLPSIFSTYVATHFFKSLNTEEAWRSIFNSSAAVVFVTCLFYFVFGSADAQQWDYKHANKSSDEQEFTEDNAEQLPCKNFVDTVK